MEYEVFRIPDDGITLKSVRISSDRVAGKVTAVRIKGELGNEGREFLITAPYSEVVISQKAMPPVDVVTIRFTRKSTAPPQTILDRLLWKVKDEEINVHAKVFDTVNMKEALKGADAESEIFSVTSYREEYPHDVASDMIRASEKQHAIFIQLLFAASDPRAVVLSQHPQL